MPHPHGPKRQPRAKAWRGWPGKWRFVGLGSQYCFSGSKVSSLRLGFFWGIQGSRNRRVDAKAFPKPQGPQQP